LKRITRLTIVGLGAALVVAPLALRADPSVPVTREAPIALLVDLKSG
jgi:hypothetical protein